MGWGAPDGSPRLSPPCIPSTLGTRAISVLGGRLLTPGPRVCIPWAGTFLWASDPSGLLSFAERPHTKGVLGKPQAHTWQWPSACGEQPVIQGPWETGRRSRGRQREPGAEAPSPHSSDSLGVSEGGGEGGKEGCGERGKEGKPRVPIGRAPSAGTRAHSGPGWLLLRPVHCSRGPCARQMSPSAGDRGHQTRPTESPTRKSPSSSGLGPVVRGGLGWGFWVLWSPQAPRVRREPWPRTQGPWAGPDLPVPAAAASAPWGPGLPTCSVTWAGDLVDPKGPACPSHRLSGPGWLRAPGSRATLGPLWPPD